VPEANCRHTISGGSCEETEIPVLGIPRRFLVAIPATAQKRQEAGRILVLPLSPIYPPLILWPGCSRLRARTRGQNPIHPQVFNHLTEVVVSVCARVSRHR
jgi:hypothetical protein